MDFAKDAFARRSANTFSAVVDISIYPSKQLLLTTNSRKPSGSSERTNLSHELQFDSITAPSLFQNQCKLTLLKPLNPRIHNQSITSDTDSSEPSKRPEFPVKFNRRLLNCFLC